MAALPLMLAGAALVLRRRVERFVVAALGFVALAAATGIPPFFDLVQKLPGFEAVRNGRLAVWAVLCVALLAGWGLDDLTGREFPASRRRMVLAIALGLLALPIVIVVARADIDPGALGDALRVAWGFTSPTPAVAPTAGGQLSDVIKLASLLEWTVLAAAAAALLALRLKGRLGATAFGVLAVALVALDLFKAGMGYNPAIAERDAVQPTTQAIRFLQDQRPARFAGLEPTAPLSFAVPLSPQRGHALRRVRRPRLRLSGPGPLRGALAAGHHPLRELQLRVLSRVGQHHAASAARPRPVRGQPPASEPARQAAARVPAGLHGAGRARLREPKRSPPRIPGGPPGGGPGRRRGAPHRNRPGLPHANGCRHRGAGRRTDPRAAGHAGRGRRRRFPRPDGDQLVQGREGRAPHPVEVGRPARAHGQLVPGMEGHR